MIQIKHILSIAIYFVFITASAQSDLFQINAELRPRLIIDDGYKTPKAKGDDTPVYSTQRTRLNFLFRNDKLETFISVQDVRIFGDDDNYKTSGVFGNTNSLCLHQAWVKLNIIEPLSLKVGRQQLLYDDQRILSTRNWNDYQVTYDALLAEYKTDQHRLHIGLSYNADNKASLLFAPEKFKSFDFIHYQYQFNQFTLSAIAILTGNTLTDVSKQVFYMGTYGANAVYKSNKANARFSAYYQHNLNNIGGNVSAACISAYAEVEMIEKLSLGLGYDYLSGNDEASASTTNHRFDILYGRRHGWYGYMDYYSTTPQQGLQDCMAKLSYNPQKELSIEMHYHYFLLAADKFDTSNPTIKLSMQLGNELDLKMKWKVYQEATLEFGYSIYGTTDTLEQLKKVNGEDLKTPQFCYFMLTIQPSVLF
ncbi:MAG: alginate export family protein [Prolixibacteraceae bacterium]|jgi:hypothetical protein|nr:alginate export family protein [Prolixibacteraceae bacterium]